MKKVLKQFAVFFIFVTFALSIQSAYVMAADDGDVAYDLVENIQAAGEKSGLPGYCPGCYSKDKSKPHEDSSYYDGATEITSTFLYLVDLIKYIVSSIAILYIVVSAVNLITAGYKVDEIISEEKEALQWIFVGLLVVFIADELVFEVFFGEEGEVLSDKDTAEDFAIEGVKLIRGLYNFLEIFIAYLAILGIVISGARMVIFAYDDETIKNAEKHITWSLASLIFVGISEIAVNTVFPILPEEDERAFFVNVGDAKNIIAGITMFLASFIAVISVAAIVYAGYLYVAFFGQDDMIEKAKKMIRSAIFAILLSAGAYVLVDAFITLTAR